VFFAATGVSDGDLLQVRGVNQHRRAGDTSASSRAALTPLPRCGVLQGVRFTTNGGSTSSIVMRHKSGTVREVRAREHDVSASCVQRLTARARPA
jgi:fructose-1,6-bisphosphatase/sedoheptulose 1,7-bisphosphatase-like protein